MVLTYDRLKEMLHYDPETGVFTWRFGRPGVTAGSVAGFDHGTGYIGIRIDRRQYFAHRLAWLYMTGSWPTQLDHRDCNRSNNRWDNLREANYSTNNANKPLTKSNNSGLKGASWNAARQKWGAFISINGKNKNLGSFETPEEAHAAYILAAARHFGEFARAA